MPDVQERLLLHVSGTHKQKTSSKQYYMFLSRRGIGFSCRDPASLSGVGVCERRQLPILASPKCSTTADCDPNIFAPIDPIVLFFSFVNGDMR